MDVVYTDTFTLLKSLLGPWGSPFLKCVVSKLALTVRGVKACQDGLGHFFPTLPGGVRACQDD